MTTQQALDTTKQVIKATKEIVSDTTIQNKVVEMLDALQNGAVTVGHEVIKYTPDVVNGVLAVTQIDGLQKLLDCLALIVCSIVLFVMTGKLYKWAKRVTEHEADDIAYLVPVLTGGIAATIIIVTLCNVIDVWMWIQVLQPKLYIAHQIIHSVLK